MMKSVTIKILALALAALMVLPMLAACGDTGETADTTGASQTEATTEKQPAVAKKDYQDAEFTAIYCADTFNENRYKIWTMRSCYHNLPSFNDNSPCTSLTSSSTSSISSINRFKSLSINLSPYLSLE